MLQPRAGLGCLWEGPRVFLDSDRWAPASAQGYMRRSGMESLAAELLQTVQVPWPGLSPPGCGLFWIPEHLLSLPNASLPSSVPPPLSPPRPNLGSHHLTPHTLPPSFTGLWCPPSGQMWLEPTVREGSPLSKGIFAGPGPSHTFPGLIAKV